MAINIDPGSGNAPPGSFDGRHTATLRWFVFALFFVFGGITSLNDILIPKLRQLFALDHASSMLVQSAFFLAYGLFSIPASLIVARLGYLRTATLGLVTMVIGCVAFVPASSNASFPFFLVALFLVGAGITIVQVVANPLISILGPASSAAGRLTFAQAFNSLGTTIFPLVGSAIILGSLESVDPATLRGAALDGYRAANARTLMHTYLGLAVALSLVALAVWSRREPLPHPHAPSAASARRASLFADRRFLFGTMCIFLYVGAEVTIGSLIVSYLMQTDVLALDPEAAGHHVPLYWGGALLGRFAGVLILRRISPGRLLAGAGCAAIALVATASVATGPIGGWSLLVIGLANAVMFPTIFSLATKNLGQEMARGSGIIATAIIGGAVIPYATGIVADLTGSQRVALMLPLLCYLCIAAYGLATASSGQSSMDASRADG